MTLTNRQILLRLQKARKKNDAAFSKHLDGAGARSSCPLCNMFQGVDKALEFAIETARNKNPDSILVE